LPITGGAFSEVALVVVVSMTRNVKPSNQIYTKNSTTGEDAPYIIPGDSVQVPLS
jgi:hypothetical protein